MTQEKIAKEFVTHIAKRLKRDMMYSIIKSKNLYEKGQSDIDLMIVPHEGELHTYFFLWMLVEGILKYGTCQHKNKKTGKITTEGLLDVMIFMGKDGVENCRQAMVSTGKYKVVMVRK